MPPEILTQGEANDGFSLERAPRAFFFERGEWEGMKTLFKEDFFKFIRCLQSWLLQLDDQQLSLE